MEGEAEPHESIEEMAEYFVKHIRQIQPQGPYLLMGMCFGGEVMYEVAQQLQAQLQNTLLTVIDTGAPENGPDWDVYEGYDQVWDGILADWLPHIPPLHQKVLITHMRVAAKQYRAKPYVGKMCLIQSQEFAQHSLKHWLSLAQGEFAYIVVPHSTHQTLLTNDDFTKLIAGHVTAYINKHLETSNMSQADSISRLENSFVSGIIPLLEELKSKNREYEIEINVLRNSQINKHPETSNTAQANSLSRLENSTISDIVTVLEELKSKNSEYENEINLLRNSRFDERLEILIDKWVNEPIMLLVNWKIVKPFLGLYQWLYKFRRRMLLRVEYEQVRQLGLIDEKAYCDAYADVRHGGLSAIEHFVALGWHENRTIGVRFDAIGYLRKHPDVLQSGMNPVLHYVRFGYNEGRE
jgi:hypothetical protein